MIATRFKWLHAALVLGLTMATGARTAEVPPSLPPLPLVDAINLALRESPTILQAEKEMQASQGIVVQTRAAVLPKLEVRGDYRERDPESVDRTIELFVPVIQPNRLWSSEVRLVQSVYEGGRLVSSVRTARLLREKALLDYKAIVSDVALRVRVAYADVVSLEQRILVAQASLDLLEKQHRDMVQRFDNGLESRFAVLRTEVEVANARPALIRAQNGHRIARQNFLHLLGQKVSTSDGGEPVLVLTDRLEVREFAVGLDDALGQARSNRVELAAQEKEAALRKEGVVTARATYKPSVQLFAGYGTRNSEYRPDLLDRVTGWSAGAQMNWTLFDGLRSKGKIDEAKARYEKALLEATDLGQRIELEVRTAFSRLAEAREILRSQEKVIEQAEEALRLAGARQENGTATQLDVLTSQTALTEARSTRVDALRDYVVALAELERAIGSY